MFPWAVNTNHRCIRHRLAAICGEGVVTKMIDGPFYTIWFNTFTSEKNFVFVIICNYPDSRDRVPILVL